MLDRYLEDYTVGEIITAPGATITEADIVEFAFRYDPQPFHVDKVKAAESIYGGLIASGWQIGPIVFRMLLHAGLLGKGSLGSPGMDDVRWLAPVRPGDTLYGIVEIVEVRESQSKRDRGVVTMLYRVDNQHGETVMSWRGVQLVLKRP